MPTHPPLPSVTLTPAGSAQADELLGLMHELYDHEQMTLDARVKAALHTLLSRPELGSALLIAHAGQTVGYCVLTYLFSLEYGGKCGLVDELYLAPAARGRGVGTAVLAALRALADQQGLHALHLEVDHANAPAQRLYARAGFRAKPRAFMTLWL